ncbi:MAG TPA: glycosyltransferase, partial [Terriglobales bacterium]
MKRCLSVIIPTRNGEQFIAKALESIRQQGDHEIEVVVIDDGSSDGTLQIVEQFKHALSIRQVATGGIGNWVAASNIGLRQASGDWACFLHQDDFWLPGRVAALRAEMENPGVSLVIHNAIFVGPQGQRLGAWTCPLPPGTVSPRRFVERLLVQNFIAMPSPIFRRKAALDCGAMDESLWYAADWDLWLRLGALGSVRFLPLALSAFRIHS